MPVYEYVCSDCHTRFDKLVRSNSQDELTCSTCSSAKVRRLVSNFAVVGGYDDSFVAQDMSAGGGGCCGGSCGCGH
ncbi:MAG: hypothetical protein NVS2B16_31590 [Chloroflexota bacterium]